MGKRGRAAEASTKDTWAYVTCTVTGLDDFPEDKIDQTEKLLNDAGFDTDESREVSMSHDGREMDMTHYYVASARLTSGRGWVTRVMRAAYAIFEKEHAALTSMAIAVRDGAEVSVWSWKCLRYSNLGLARPAYIKNAAAAGAHVADIGGKQRVLLKMERVFSLGTQRDDFVESYEAAHYVPSSVVDGIASSVSGKTKS